jgi:hypothetical protein
MGEWPHTVSTQSDVVSAQAATTWTRLRSAFSSSSLLSSSVDLRQLHDTLGFGGDTRIVAGGDRRSRRRDDIEFSIPNPCVGGLRDD